MMKALAGILIAVSISGMSMTAYAAEKDIATNQGYSVEKISKEYIIHGKRETHPEDKQPMTIPGKIIPAGSSQKPSADMVSYAKR